MGQWMNEVEKGRLRVKERKNKIQEGTWGKSSLDTGIAYFSISKSAAGRHGMARRCLQSAAALFFFFFDGDTPLYPKVCKAASWKCTLEHKMYKLNEHNLGKTSAEWFCWTFICNMAVLRETWEQLPSNFFNLKKYLTCSGFAMLSLEGFQIWMKSFQKHCGHFGARVTKKSSRFIKRWTRLKIKWWLIRKSKFGLHSKVAKFQLFHSPKKE